MVPERQKANSKADQKANTASWLAVSFCLLHQPRQPGHLPVRHPPNHLILHIHRGQTGPADQTAHNKLVAFSNEAHGRAEMMELVLTR